MILNVPPVTSITLFTLFKSTLPLTIRVVPEATTILQEVVSPSVNWFEICQSRSTVTEEHWRKVQVDEPIAISVAPRVSSVIAAEELSIFRRPAPETERSNFIAVLD